MTLRRHLLVLMAATAGRAVNVVPHPEHDYHGEKFYQYGYQVDDKYTGDYHGHMEHTAGHLTKGEYKVALPDGRVQVVSYEADRNGFRPRITYEPGQLPHPGDLPHPEHPEHFEHLERHPPPPSYDPRPPASYVPPPLPEIRIPHQSPEAAYSLTERPALLPVLPTPLPRRPAHHRINYNLVHTFQLPTQGHEAEYGHPAPVRHSPAPVNYTPAPLNYTPAPVHHTPAPVHHTPAPLNYTPAPVHHTPAPVHHTPAPVHHTPAPVHHTPAPVHHTPAPVHHTPAPVQHTLLQALDMSTPVHNSLGQAPLGLAPMQHPFAPEPQSPFLEANQGGLRPVQPGPAITLEAALEAATLQAALPRSPLPRSSLPRPGRPTHCPAPAFLPSRAACQGRTSQCWSEGVPDLDCPGSALCCNDGCANVCLPPPAPRLPPPAPHRHPPPSSRRKDPGPATSPRPRRPLPTAYHAMRSHTYIAPSPSPTPRPSPRLLHRADPRIFTGAGDEEAAGVCPQEAAGLYPQEAASLYPYLYVLSSYVPREEEGSSLVVARRV